MQKVVVHQFGGLDQLQFEEHPTPTPTGHQVLIQMTSIGMNHADLMARRGEYKIASGDPPFTPGLEGGGIVEAVGDKVTTFKHGDRVTLSVDAPRRVLGGQGTYQTHYLTTEDKVVPVPDAMDLETIGALWLPYLTAWGCLIWKQNLRPGQTVLIPAASSSVAIAASQVVKDYGGFPIGTTTSPDKVDRLNDMPEAMFDELIVTSEPQWWKKVKAATDGRGCDVIFDPVGAGAFANTEIRLLAPGGTLWIYGLLGKTDVVDLAPLIRLRASVRGWVLTELAELSETNPTELNHAYVHILQRLADETYRLPVARTYPLEEVRYAHEQMEQGSHIGKLILVP